MMVFLVRADGSESWPSHLVKLTHNEKHRCAASEKKKKVTKISAIAGIQQVSTEVERLKHIASARARAKCQTEGTRKLPRQGGARQRTVTNKNILSNCGTTAGVSVSLEYLILLQLNSPCRESSSCQLRSSRVMHYAFPWFSRCCSSTKPSREIRFHEIAIAKYTLKMLLKISPART